MLADVGAQLELHRAWRRLSDAEELPLLDHEMSSRASTVTSIRAKSEGCRRMESSGCRRLGGRAASGSLEAQS